MKKLTLDIAEKLSKSARKKAEEFGVSITVSIVDDSGRLVYCARGDNTGFLTTETSRAKALASAAFKKTTKELLEMQKSNPAFWSTLPSILNESVLPTTGGVPVVVGGQIIGAIGIGGASPEQDHECAVAASEITEML